MNERKEEIIKLLYRFRFLKRDQIQKLLGHKNHRNILNWLNELTKTNYLKRYYNPNTITYPAIYSLGLEGRSYLKEHTKELSINKKILDQIWRQEKLSIQYRFHCLTLADCYLSLIETTKTTGAKLHFYTKNDLSGIKYLINPHPDAYFHIQETKGTKKYYFLDIFDYYLNNLKFIQRIQKYLDYFDNGLWQEHTENCPFPSVIFVCADDRSFSYLNWYLPKILEDNEEIDFYIITKEKIKSEGINKNTLRKMEIKD